MIPIISDAGPILTFARANRLELPRAVLPQLIISPVVFGEIAVKGAGKPGSDEIRQSLGEWITVQPLKDPAFLNQVKGLDPGEREAIAVALETGGTLLIDEKMGRAEARRLGIPLLSTLAVLEDALVSGLIPRVKPILDELIEAGFRLHRNLYEQFLISLRES